MYRLTVRDRVMIAHSFKGEIFGPAQGVHGATFVVEAEFQAPVLDEYNLVVDIGLAHQALAGILKTINYKQLDELPIFAGQNTTTEFLASWIWGELAAAIKEGRMGPHDLSGLAVCLRESDVAWASYEAPLD
ncbi:MAG: 6-carboxytetrahydropterin synthase [Myxococcota bacterium]|jgi:6-pyruvoyl-tetrahydropterin synthase|nr:6-carboxytetrahydropterin synthase [Myxococcota bacterium]MEC9388657.1 6-carboxytetrahydropterin synthase [Myxococcota bacterium]